MMADASAFCALRGELAASAVNRCFSECWLGLARGGNRAMAQVKPDRSSQDGDRGQDVHHVEGGAGEKPGIGAQELDEEAA